MTVKASKGKEQPNIGEKVQNFADCGFTLKIPTLTPASKHVLVSTILKFRMNSDDELVLDSGWIIDPARNIFTADIYNKYITLLDEGEFEIAIPLPDKRPVWRNSRLVLNFLASTGTKYEICYVCDAKRRLQLEYVLPQLMTVNDKIHFRKVESAVEAGYGSSKDLIDTKTSSSKASLNYNLKDYLTALVQEKKFLESRGGRQHKLSNGVRIRYTQNTYGYRFELEDELFLSDDTPVKLTVNGRTVSGHVVLCESFEITILFQQDLGQKVESATLNAEPWGLLDAQVSVINQALRNHATSHIFDLLINEGPALASSESTLNIPMGQEQAIRKALTSPVTFIWGPPGTGKTYTMAEIAIQFLQQGKTVLIVSHSNVSVDGAIKKVGELIRNKHLDKMLKSGKVLRHGYVRDKILNADDDLAAFNYTLSRNKKLISEKNELTKKKESMRRNGLQNDPEFLKTETRLKSIRNQVKELQTGYVCRAKLIATTISKVNMDQIFKDRQYDVVMFDEVSMAYVTQIFCAAAHAREHFIAIGDFRQLPPIVQSKSENVQVLKQDIFSYLKIWTNGQLHNHPWLVMLNEQRRMDPTIANFPSQYIYGGLLKDDKSVKDRKWDLVRGKGKLTRELNFKALNLIDLSGTYCAAASNSQHSHFNILSALITFGTAITLESEGHIDVGIVAPYNAQAQLIRAMLKDYENMKKPLYETDKPKIVCSIIHQFQGSERDAIIFDSVDSYPFAKPGLIYTADGDDQVKRLINVAITRSKAQLVAVTNRRFWNNKLKNSTHIVRQLFNHMKKNGEIISTQDGKLEDCLKKLAYGPAIKFYPASSGTSDKKKIKKDLTEDISKAKRTIHILVPAGQGIESISKDIMDAIQLRKEKHVQVDIRCDMGYGIWEKYQLNCYPAQNIIFPLIVIDSQIIWHDLPASQRTFRDGNHGYGANCKTVFRITGKHTVEMIQSLFNPDNRLDLVQQTSPSQGLSGKSRSGSFSKYIFNTYECSQCGKSLKLARNPVGTYFLSCSNQHYEHITINLMNEYLDAEHVRCPIHRCRLEPRIGDYGPYLRCPEGHNLKPDEI